MKEKDRIRILFIGNSHTFVNDLPKIVADLAGGNGIQADVTMIAHGGWYLKQHTKEPDVPFNIKYGNYDYVVLQEHSHPFDHLDYYEEAMETLAGWIHGVGSIPVIFATWSTKREPEKQELMNETNRRLAKKHDTMLAPVGEGWWEQARNYPETDLYWQDGEHASPAGSAFAAKVIWETIYSDYLKKQRDASE